MSKRRPAASNLMHLLEQGLAAHQVGRLDAAGAIYQRVLAAEPNNPYALHLLGEIAFRSGQNDRAIELIGHAVAVKPDYAEAHNNLGAAYAANGDRARAEAHFRRSIKLSPRFAHAYNNLGSTLKNAGLLEEAGQCYRRALMLEPRLAEAHNNYGTLLRETGRYQEAEAKLRQAIALRPDYAEAYNNLGLLLGQIGNPAAALAQFDRALALNPMVAEAHTNRGNALAELGRNDDAIAALKRALELRPNDQRFLANLGATCQRLGRLDEAIAAFRRALDARPDSADVLVNLGAFLRERGETEAAIDNLRRALAVAPNHADAHNNLGLCLHQQGRLDDALAAFDQAIMLAPAAPEAHSNRGSVLLEQGQLDAAIAGLERALALDPNCAHSHNSLGLAHEQLGRKDQAMACFRRALEIDPRIAEAYSNLGNTLLDQGDAEAAIESLKQAVALRPKGARFLNNLGTACLKQGRLDDALDPLRRALEMQPELTVAHDNLIFTLDFDPRIDLAGALAERRRWAERYARPLTAVAAPHRNDPDPERRLRVGYVSADFKRHSAADCLLPIIATHSASVEVYCYSGVRQPDDMTARFRELAAVWREAYAQSDDALARTIREDGIDILVDLSGFTKGNRLLVFARRPAPVQVHGWGYALGTGMDAMDYILSDRVLIAEDERRFYVEKVAYLPNLFVYMPPANAAEITALPALQRGHFTFGSFNRFSKVTPEVLGLWARLLHEAPSARLLLKDSALDDGETRQKVLATFAAAGIAAERIDIQGRTGKLDHLAACREADLVLDSFPQNGGITTLECLWMGVPMVTLPGTRPQGRVGASILSTLGLGDFIAASPDDYAARAVRWTQNPAALAELRATLRETLSRSIICDHAAYGAATEAVYRDMWRRWCAAARSSSARTHLPPT
ncbi:MAG: tetratricopeptide repeat protein [Proteobacteria bacterium]|nr:tetratricopeptide repeat protein [Pseudomonadota bacterium]